MTSVGRRKRASLSVVYTGQAPSISPPSQVIIRQGLGMHDVIEIMYPQRQPWMSSMSPGTPMRLAWGNTLGAAEIFGYLSHVAPITTTTQAQPVKIFCVGASYPLKQRGTEVWVDETASQIVAIIARKFNMQVVADRDNNRIGQVAQAGRTYWEVLLDLADRVGCVIRVEGAAIIFRRRDSLIDAGMASAPVFSMGSKVKNAGNLSPEERSLWHFRPKVGGYLDIGDPRAFQSVSGVDPVTAEYIQSQTAPGGQSLRSDSIPVRFTAYPADRVVSSLTTAETISGAKSERVRMSVPADAVASGDARTHPGQPVYIMGTGSDTDGYWVVDEVVHNVFSAGEYEMDLKVVTDSLGTGKSGAFRPTSPPNRPLRDLVHAMNTPRPVLTPNLLPAKPGSKDQYWTAGGAR